MAMTLQEAIDFATVPSYEKPYGTTTGFTVSMHDDLGTVLAGSAEFLDYPPGEPGGKPTFHPDLPLRDWGPARIDRGFARAGSWFNRSVPGFSTRGQGGMMLNVAVGDGTAIPIDVSLRRDSGFSPFLGFLGLGPSVQVEIEKLSGPGGTATSGVTLKAAEDGGLLRSVGPSVRDPARNVSYTVTIFVAEIIA